MKRPVALCLTLALAVALPLAALAQERTVCFGYSLPLSGEHAQYGEVFRNAALLAVEEFNSAGRLPGVRVEIKFEDSRSDPKEAKNIAAKFIDDKCVLGVLGDMGTTASLAAGAHYAQAGLAQLTPTASHPDFTKLSPYQFRNIYTQAFEGPFNAAWVLEAGHRTVAVAAVQNDWGVSAATEFKKAYEARGGRVTALEYSNPGLRDFRAILTKLGRDNPQALYICLMYEEGAMFLQQRRQLGLKTPIFGASPLYSPKLIDLGGEAVEGLLLPSAFAPQSPDPQVQAFVAAYQRRYQAEPNVWAAQSYDAVGIMLAALVKVGPLASRQAFRDALAATREYPGVTGLTTFDPITREPLKTLVKMRVHQGRFTLVQD